MQSKSQFFEAQQGLATTADAVTFLRLSRSTLWRLERQGALQPVRIGRALRFRWADLQRLAREGGAA
ncbi:MAG: helix-turn-helix domain-containing protein [Pseudomonadota bacterium]